jgi:hypothetical protein
MFSARPAGPRPDAADPAGFAKEAPPPQNADVASYPQTLILTMRPLGFTAPTMRLSWPMTVFVVWAGGTIGCTVGGDIPTVIPVGVTWSGSSSFQVDQDRSLSEPRKQRFEPHRRPIQRTQPGSSVAR